VPRTSTSPCCTSYNKLSGEGENMKLVAEVALQMSVKIKLLFAVTELNASTSIRVYLGISQYTINYVRPKRIIPHSKNGIGDTYNDSGNKLQQNWVHDKLQFTPTERKLHEPVKRSLTQIRVRPVIPCRATRSCPCPCQEGICGELKYSSTRS
jgi:hypothetical protein